LRIRPGAGKRTSTLFSDKAETEDPSPSPDLSGFRGMKLREEKCSIPISFPSEQG